MLQRRFSEPSLEKMKSNSPLTLEDLTVQEGSKIVDEKQWKLDVLDLHQVMSAAQHLYLKLEQSNEALVRVALEIASCRRARRVLWWKDGWWSEEEKRNNFKTLVGMKLADVIAPLKGRTPQKLMTSAPEDEGPSEETLQLRGKVKELEARVSKEERACHEKGMMLASAEREAEEANRRFKESEEAAKELRNALRKNGEASGEASRVLQEAEQKLRDAEKRIEAFEVAEKLASKKSEELTAKLSEAERLLKGMVGNADYVQAKQRAEEAEAKIKDLTRDLAEAQARAQKEKEAAAAAAAAAAKAEALAAQKPAAVKEITKHDPQADAELRSLRDKASVLQAEMEAERQRADSLEATGKETSSQLVTANAQLEELRKLLDAAKREAEEALAALAVAKEPPKQKEPQPVVESAPDHEKRELKAQVKAQKAELEEKLNEIEELQTKITRMEARSEKQKTAFAELAEQKEAAEAKLMRTLKLMQQLKEQLKRLEEIASRKGLGKVVAEIMEESNIKETLNSKEYSCFDRLYEDAQRRQEKTRQFNAKHGIVTRVGRGSQVLVDDAADFGSGAGIVAGAADDIRAGGDSSTSWPLGALREAAGGNMQSWRQPPHLGQLAHAQSSPNLPFRGTEPASGTHSFSSALPFSSMRSTFSTNFSATATGGASLGTNAGAGGFMGAATGSSWRTGSTSSFNKGAWRGGGGSTHVSGLADADDTVGHAGIGDGVGRSLGILPKQGLRKQMLQHAATSTGFGLRQPRGLMRVGLRDDGGDRALQNSTSLPSLVINGGSGVKP